MRPSARWISASSDMVLPDPVLRLQAAPDRHQAADAAADRGQCLGRQGDVITADRDLQHDTGNGCRDRGSIAYRNFIS